MTYQEKIEKFIKFWNKILLSAYSNRMIESADYHFRINYHWDNGELKYEVEHRGKKVPIDPYGRGIKIFNKLTDAELFLIQNLKNGIEIWLEEFHESGLIKKREYAALCEEFKFLLEQE